MMTQATLATPPGTADTLAAARQIAPELARRALEIERGATLPSDLVERIRRAGLFRMALPAALGGLELPPSTIMDTVEELARADGSTGWTALIGNGTAFLAWLDPSAAADLVAGADPTSASVFGPTGRLVPQGSGFELTGRWSFASGCRHAELFLGGATVVDEDRPGPPDWRMAVVRARQFTVSENWDAAGLRGTGSDDVLVTAAAVPPELVMTPFTTAARHPGPLYRLPFFTLVGVLMVGFPLGVARRALDEFAALAPARMRPPGPGSIALDDDVQVALARAEGRLQAARALVVDALGAVWDSALAGDVPDDATRGRFLLATQEAMAAATAAVDLVFVHCGAGALRVEHPVQRCLRDVRAAGQHIYFSAAGAKRYAKLRLGVDQQTMWF